MPCPAAYPRHIRENTLGSQIHLPWSMYLLRGHGPDLKYVIGKMASLPRIRISYNLPFSSALLSWYCWVWSRRYQNSGLKIDLNSSGILLLWGMKEAKLVFLQIFSLKGSFVWWKSTPLSFFTGERGIFLAIKPSMTLQLSLQILVSEQS